MCTIDLEKNLRDRSVENNITRLEYVEIENKKYPKYINEFWTAKQRQASSLHEIFALHALCPVRSRAATQRQALSLFQRWVA